MGFLWMADIFEVVLSFIFRICEAFCNNLLKYWYASEKFWGTMEHLQEERYNMIQRVC